MGQHLVTHDPCDPSDFRDPFDPFPALLQVHTYDRWETTQTRLLALRLRSHSQQKYD